MSKTHGLSNTKLYRKYRSMLDRCSNERNKSYADYGGRGIAVCDEWKYKDGFLNFYDWAIKSGYEDGLTIERKDVNKGYNPENCCWVSMEQQQRNKRSNVVFMRNGVPILETDLAKELGVTEGTIIARVKRGKDVFAPKYVWKKPVIRDDGVIYSSIREAAKQNGVHETKVGMVCRGERKRTANHSFRFLTQSEAEEKLRELEESHEI